MSGRLSIDFGTSTTVAMLVRQDGRPAPLLFDGSPLLPSAVFADADGDLLVGRDAWHSGRVSPERLEPNPKRRVDDGTVLLGDREVPVVDLIAAVLRRVAAEAARVSGAPVGEVTLTHPIAWGNPRREVLCRAARAAGLPPPALVAEPVAAADHFVRTFAGAVPVGGCVAVYDFGAGTFDASVLRRTAEGLVPLASEGLPDTGGLDIDAAVLEHLARAGADRDGDRWRELVTPATPAQRRASRQLWDDVRAGKEMLSRAATTVVPLPAPGTDALLSREEFDRLAEPIVARTVAALRAAVDRAGVPVADLAGVYLVGGSSRVPLAATLLHRALGRAPTAIEWPELVVAEGALAAPPPAGTPAPPPVPPRVVALRTRTRSSPRRPSPCSPPRRPPAPSPSHSPPRRDGSRSWPASARPSARRCTGCCSPRCSCWASAGSPRPSRSREAGRPPSAGWPRSRARRPPGSPVPTWCWPRSSRWAVPAT
ncbi:Hsp70 family protein [Phytohabitans houttuyneae]|uniref:Molecular chaperone DnaK n=1 Tax=Phytohabitans houttuyneae TaxID=1076126 RepID=A0A6V8KBD5_9ACTN|nr:Hsp70 family protein [Phytohabitans houttuyneae]GFJ82552.1 hypothetical protein Phou_067320 [Phytohabitans houttuyneae]